jgi:hypothetical protein
MKELLNKIMPLLEKLKGKKTSVVIVTIAIVLVGYLGVHYGMISEDALNIDLIINSVGSLFDKSAVDTVSTQITDTTIVLQDTLK